MLVLILAFVQPGLVATLTEGETEDEAGAS